MKRRLSESLSVLCLSLLLASLGFVAPAFGDSVNTALRQVTQLADGVYSIRHQDPTDDFPDGNTTVIIGSREVFVVDSCYLPSSAKRDIDDIRQWTSKPVRYLLNSHWHNDHNGGNKVYKDAFPALDILAHTETRAMMDMRIPSYVARYTDDNSVFGKDRARLRTIIETGKDETGKPLTDKARAEAARELALKERALMEFRQFAYQAPTMTFDSELNVDLGNREVQLKFLGRGNTGGDVVAYLPAEKILIAGDLLDHPIPYAFGGHPSEWIHTLERIAQMDANVIVPGHGDILRDKTYLNNVIDLLKMIVTKVNAEISRKGSAATLEDVTRSIDLSDLRRKMAGDDKDNLEFFDASMSSLIRLVFNEVKAR